MNVVNEGLILVNKDFTVTHINHVAEKNLGLLPGEIIGQAISRKISNEDILTHLETSSVAFRAVTSGNVSLTYNLLL